MADAIRTRGPDASGVWVDADSGVALGHQRLAIIDLSLHGHQPKPSRSGRYRIVFNGEIYNFRQLQLELTRLGHVFASHSDTEVLLAAIEQWGVAGALPKLTGMFAFGVWDAEDKRLILARDRLGEKPLYYGWHGAHFLFASELKALRANSHFSAQLDRTALDSYFRFSYVPDPFCIYQNVQKLLPGTYAVVDPTRPDAPRPQTYWSAVATVDAALTRPFTGSEDDAVDELDHLLRSVITDQMISDVPRGIFLSGGIDSSLVAAVAQAQSSDCVRTFSIGFGLADYDESAHARAVASHLGTQHHDLHVSPEDALSVIPQLAAIYDEPFADSSQVPTYLLCKMARQHVTVCLSGDGGDETFGGYNRYLWVERLWNVLRCAPEYARRSLSEAIHLLSSDAWADLYRRIPAALVPDGLRVRLPGQRLYKFAGLLSAENEADVYRTLISSGAGSESLIQTADRPSSIWPGQIPTQLPGRSFAEQMMLSDLVTYLPGDILVKVDRAAMANSLETRAPFLDHRLVDFCWRLPPSFRIRRQKSKWILRRLLDRYVPRPLVERPKMGFALPLAEWLRGPLREWAEGLLSEARLREAGILSPPAVRRLWADHVSCKRNAEPQLWSILILQDWLAKQQLAV